MAYDCTKQFRCTIIRGKAMNDLDNLLPLYVNILARVCPTDKISFVQSFRSELSNYLREAPEKTLDNHRTEIAGKLFGLFQENEHNLIVMTAAASRLLESRDQVAFFKDRCFRLQFPNGMDSIHTLKKKIDKNISIRQLSFLLETLYLLEEDGLFITKKEIGYYILNSLDVLTGAATPREVKKAILLDKRSNISREIRYPGKQASYNYQHINEQLNLLLLANLVILDGMVVSLNHRENKTIDFFRSKSTTDPGFNVYKYDLSNPWQRKQMYRDWQEYYSQITLVDDEEFFATDVSSLGIPEEETSESLVSTTDIGKQGERIVLNLEKQRVARFNSRLLYQVQDLSNIKGLGYDIQSLEATGPTPERKKYIEVKTTARTTSPEHDEKYPDSITLTRNEWTTAEGNGDLYYVYRVYLFRGGRKVLVIRNPYAKFSSRAVPLSYRIDLTKDDFDCSMESEEK